MSDKKYIAICILVLCLACGCVSPTYRETLKEQRDASPWSGGVDAPPSDMERIMGAKDSDEAAVKARRLPQ
jgi:hypothetical protein